MKDEFHSASLTEAVFLWKNIKKTLTINALDDMIIQLLHACGRSAPFWDMPLREGKEAEGTMELLKSGEKKVVGTKQVTRVLKAGSARRAYVANDADTFIFQQVVRAAEEAGVPCVRVPSMKELGMTCGIEVPTAAAAVLKVNS